MGRRTAARAPALVLVLLLVSAVLGAVGGTSAHGDEPLPPPPGATAPPDDGVNEVPPGPTYVITPSAGGTALGEPVDPAEVDRAEEQERDRGRTAAATGSPTPTPTPEATRTAATAVDPEAPAAVTGDRQDPPAQDGESPWWAIGPGVLLLLALAEVARRALRTRRRGLHI